MVADGFEADIPKDLAYESHAKIYSVPDFYNEPSVIDLAWEDIKTNKPELRHELSRIAIEYGGNDAEKRAWITKSLLSLYVVLKNVSEVAKFNKSIDDQLGN
mgnify:CR=1 FL=1